MYDLEAIQKKKDETTKELVACIHHMAARAHKGDGSTVAIEFEVQCRFIRAITDDETELRQRLLAAPLTAMTNELLTIAESYYAVECGAQQMSSSGTKSVNAVHTGKPYRKGQSKQTQRKQQTGSDCDNCTKKHKPGNANFSAHESICNKCGHTGHWQAKCRGGAPPHRQSDKSKPTKRHRQQGKKGRTDLVDLDDYDSHYDEIELHNDDLDEIKLDDMVEPWKTEAYTIVHLPTSNNSKTNASVKLKVDTGAGGNVMPL